MTPSKLLPEVYDELRRLAASALAAESPGHTLDATALVHEAWLKLERRPAFASRTDYLLAAAQAMRRILVDHARRRATQKRGGGRVRVPLDTLERWQGSPEDVLDLDAALQRFAAEEPLKARLVELRFFSGMTLPEAAATLGISQASAERWWQFARLWLHAGLAEEESSSS